MEIRLAKREDLAEILKIYEYARGFMAQNGNPTQWKTSYPPIETVENDIEMQKLHVCIENKKIACVFFYNEGIDPTYNVIDGAWLNDKPYGVVHRIASAEGIRGAATFCLTWAYDNCKNLKIDTHENNIPMQNLLKKLGFDHCGTITLANGEPRWAYQKD